MISLNALRVLKQQALKGDSEAQEALCRLVINYEHPTALDIVLTGHYTPCDSDQRTRFIESLTKILIRIDEPQVRQNILTYLEKFSEDPLAIGVILAAWYLPRHTQQQTLFTYLLMEKLIQNEDPQVRRKTLNILEQLATDSKVGRSVLKILEEQAKNGNSEAQETLCRLMLNHDHPQASDIILTAQYTPSSPKQLTHFIKKLTEKLIRNDEPLEEQRMFRVLETLAREGNLEAQETLCCLMFEYNRPQAREIVLVAQYIPYHPKWRRCLITLLTRMFIWNAEPDLRRKVFHMLEKLAADGDPDARDALCRIVIECNYPPAREIVLAAHYAPQEPHQQALLFFLTEQWDNYDRLDGDQHLIQTVYPRTMPEVRKRLIACARQADRLNWIPAAVQNQSSEWFSEMLDDEWEMLLTVLCEKRAYQNMWQLAQATPALWSVQLLLRLKETGWMPKSAPEREAFTTLVRLAKVCAEAGTELPGGVISRYPKLPKKTGCPGCAAVSPDGQRLAYKGTNGIHIWNLQAGALQQTLEVEGYLGVMTCILFSPDGRMLASGDSNGDLTLWSLADGATHTLKGHTQQITCLAISPDEGLLASGSYDKTIRLWSLPEGTALTVLNEHIGKVTFLAFSPDGGLLASGDRENNLRIWSVPDWTLLHALHTRDQNFVLRPDWRLLATGNSTGSTVQLWSLPAGIMIKTLEGQRRGIRCLALSPNGRLLASGSDDRTIRLWSLPDGAALHTLKGHTSEVRSVVFSPDGNALISRDKRNTRVWDVRFADLRSLSAGHSRPEDVQAARNTLKEETIPAITRKWLEFGLALMRRHFSVRASDVLNEIRKNPAATQRVEVSAFLMSACQEADDAQIVVNICESLAKNGNHKAIDFLCARWLETREPLLAQAILQTGYVARQPLSVRVFSALKADKPEFLRDGGAEIIEPLVQAVEDIDVKVAVRARQILSQIRSIAAQEAFCQYIIDHKNPIAQEIARSAGYLPRDVSQKALFLFLTEQWEHYESLDFDHTLLTVIFQTASPQLRRRLTTLIRKAGRTDFLKILVGQDYSSYAADMTPEETEVLVRVLSDKREWAKLWKLVFELSPIWGIRIVNILCSHAWQPEQEDERIVLQELRKFANTESEPSQEVIRQALPMALHMATIRVHGRVNAIAFSPVGPVLAIGTNARKVALWNFQQGEMENVLRGFEHTIGAVTFLPDGRMVCAERAHNPKGQSALYIWDGHQQFRFGRHIGGITSIEVVPPSTVVSTGRDKTLAVWDAQTGQKIKEISLSFWARATTISPDKQYIALLHNGVTLMKYPSLKEIEEWSDHKISRCATFGSPEGVLIVGRFNGDVLAFEYPPAHPRLHVPYSLSPHHRPIQGVIAFPQSSTIITAGAEGILHFTDWTNRELLGSIKNPGSRLTSLHISPDGAFMATGTTEALISLWELPVLRLHRLLDSPLLQASREDLAVVKRLITASPALDCQVQQAFKFVQCILQHRLRFDIEIHEVSEIKVGEFDIEIGV